MDLILTKTTDLPKDIANIIYNYIIDESNKFFLNKHTSLSYKLKILSVKQLRKMCLRKCLIPGNSNKKGLIKKLAPISDISDITEYNAYLYCLEKDRIYAREGDVGEGITCLSWYRSRYGPRRIDEFFGGVLTV